MSAQWNENASSIFPSILSKRVGIGTSTPGASLHVEGNAVASTGSGAFVQLWADNAFIWKHASSQGGLRFGSATDMNAAGWSEKMRITDYGFVGIGTNNPEHKLDVRGNIYSSGTIYIDGGDLELRRTTHAYGFVTRPNVTGYKNLQFAVAGGGSLESIVLRSDISFFTGKVGIGILNTGSYKLAVEGKIGAREVKVTLENPWADYVFSEHYSLIDLKALEAYIKKNNHLPGIPSAEEVKENGGIDLGEMNRKLLEKVEELTLYIINLKKENNQIKETVEELKERLK